MFSRVLALLAVLLLSANTWAAIEINNHQARNMDDENGCGIRPVISRRRKFPQRVFYFCP